MKIFSRKKSSKGKIQEQKLSKIECVAGRTNSVAAKDSANFLQPPERLFSYLTNNKKFFHNSDEYTNNMVNQVMQTEAHFLAHTSRRATLPNSHSRFQCIHSVSS